MYAKIEKTPDGKRNSVEWEGEEISLVIDEFGDLVVLKNGWVIVKIDKDTKKLIISSCLFKTIDILDTNKKQILEDTDNEGS